jgi:hypothetical protein
MMKKLLFLALIVIACKDRDVEPARLLSMEFYSIPAVIQDKTITVTLTEDQLWSAVPLTYQNSGKGYFKINNQRVTSGEFIDLAVLETLDFYEGDKLLITYTLDKRSIYQNYGMGKLLQGRHSLNRSYTYYFDQYNTGIHQYINCGPTVTTMAMLWSDSSYKELPEYARSQIRAEGGWWFTSDIFSFLQDRGVTPGYIPLPQSYTDLEYTQRLKEVLDQGLLAILCLDMHYVRQNPNPEQRTNRFYTAAAPGWGHFILVKGYREVDDKVWLEINDPYSLGMQYENGKLKGENRFYSPEELKKATDIWWPYMIAVPQKGKGLRMKSTLIPPAQKGRGDFR